MPRQAGLTPIEVVVGVLTDDRDRVLIQQRTGGPFAGLWELPGGKIEHAENPRDALARELHEELGVTVTAAGPIIRITHRYPDRTVTLNTFEVSRYHGTARGREGQAVKWVRRGQLFDEHMLPADGPVCMAINLPDRYLITPDIVTAVSADVRAQFVTALEASLAAGVRLVCLRCPSLGDDDYAGLARDVSARCRAARAHLMLHGGVQRADLAGEVAAAGLHLPARVANGLEASPLADGLWLAVSAHSARDLRQAARMGAEFAVLGTVQPSASHPGGAVLGWDGFAALVGPAALPVYAIGGLGADDIARSRGAGGQGVAAIRALWPLV